MHQSVAQLPRQRTIQSGSTAIDEVIEPVTVARAIALLDPCLRILAGGRRREWAQVARMPPYRDLTVSGGALTAHQAASAANPAELAAAAISVTWLMAAVVVVVLAYIILTPPRR